MLKFHVRGFHWMLLGNYSCDIYWLLIKPSLQKAVNGFSMHLINHFIQFFAIWCVKFHQVLSDSSDFQACWFILQPDLHKAESNSTFSVLPDPVYQLTCCNIPEDLSLLNLCCCENLMAHMMKVVWRCNIAVTETCHRCNTETDVHTLPEWLIWRQCANMSAGLAEGLVVYLVQRLTSKPTQT